MESPIKTDFAHLVANQVIISVDESVHVTVKTLKAVHGFNVKLYFHKVLWVCADHKVHIVPVR